MISICYVRYENYLESGGGKKGKEKRKRRIENKDVSVVLEFKNNHLDYTML